MEDFTDVKVLSELVRNYLTEVSIQRSDRLTILYLTTSLTYINRNS